MNYGRILAGGVLLALGTILAFDAAGVVDGGDVVADWWPVVFLAGAVLMYAASPRRWAVPLVIGVLSATALMVTTGTVDESIWRLVWPAVLILAGVWFIVGRTSTGRVAVDDDHVRSFVMFSGGELASHSPNFQGGNVAAVFGGTELDLRDADLARGASLDVFTAFGGTELRVPEGWNVAIHGMPLFGGFDNITTKERLADDAPRLDVHATVLFGGLEVKH